jgi:hypothetical protein
MPMPPTKESNSIGRLVEAIRSLPSDAPVPDRTPGYNNYNTQKDHWLGWLDPTLGRGSYLRSASSERDARSVYNHIGEPKMLLWLISATRIDKTLVKAAEEASWEAESLAGKCAAIRRHVPWSVVEKALEIE